MEHLGSVFNEPQHLSVGDPSEPDCIRVFPWIPVIDPVHIRKNLTPVRFQICRQSHRCGIRTAPAQSGGIAIFRNSLEARHHHHFSCIQFPENPGIIHIHDPGIAVYPVGMDPGLGPRQTDRRTPQRTHCHGHQRSRHLLSGCNAGIHFPDRAPGIDLQGFLDHFVRGIPLGRYHHNHPAALHGKPCHSGCRQLYFPRIRQGCSSVFLNDQHFTPLPILHLMPQGAKRAVATKKLPPKRAAAF